MNILRFDGRTSKRNGNIVFGLLFFIISYNILTLSSPLGLLVTIPQCIIVLYLLVKGDIKRALLYHCMFIITGLSAQGTLGMFDVKGFSMYNYGTLKLVGPIRVFYFFNILFCLLSYGKPHDINSLFYKLFKIMKYLAVSAISIGLLGLIFDSGYSFSAFVDNVVFMFVVLSTMFILLKNADEKFIYSLYNISILGIMAGMCASFFCYKALGVVSHYSVYDMMYMADVAAYFPVLIIGVLSQNYKTFFYITSLVFLLFTLEAMGGKTVFVFAFVLGCLFYLVFIDKKTIYHTQINIKLYKMVCVLMVLAVGAIAVVKMSEESMAFYKFQSAMTMVSGNMDEMSRSPYIRVASLANIVHEGLYNPITLLFGKGYGGYFEDGLGLFVGIDLSNGAWGDADIKSGMFHSGHDTLVTIPFFNGLIGLYLILKIAWLYIKRINVNYMNGIIFSWLIMQFYFNTLAAAIAIICLMGAEYELNRTIDN